MEKIWIKILQKTWEWVNNDIMFIFWVHCSFKAPVFSLHGCCVEWKLRNRWFTSGFLSTVKSRQHLQPSSLTLLLEITVSEEKSKTLVVISRIGRAIKSHFIGFTQMWERLMNILPTMSLQQINLGFIIKIKLTARPCYSQFYSES